MEKDLAGRVNRLFCLGFVISSLACAQEATTSLSYTWDQPTGDFYATAQATLDYNSSYYYYVCVYIDLWQSSTDTFTYTSGVCDDEDAEQDWYTSVSGFPVTIDVESENDIYMDYYASQYSGGYPDGYCWDAYQAYYFDDFTDESGAADYDFDGPPGQGIPITYIPLFEFAETYACDFTVSTSTFTSQYCGASVETMPFSVTMSYPACTSMILHDSNTDYNNCSVGTPSGDIELDYVDYYPPPLVPWVCHIINGTGASGSAYILGPSYGTSGGVPVTFSLTFYGQVAIPRSGTTTVNASSLCPH
jgi:hypothetical protein